MSEATKRILEMLSQEKISVEEAEKLLAALTDSGERENNAEGDSPSLSPKYLKMVAEDDSGQGAFRMKVPLSLIRAGIKLKDLIPEEARKRANLELQIKGIDLDPFELAPEQIEEFIQTLGELEIEADGDGGRFHLHFE